MVKLVSLDNRSANGEADGQQTWSNYGMEGIFAISAYTNIFDLEFKVLVFIIIDVEY